MAEIVYDPNETKLWWWIPPAEGELVPDYPPTYLGDMISDVQLTEERKADEE